VRILEILEEGYEVKKRLLRTRLSEEDSLRIEKLYIEKIGRTTLDTGPLLNISGGGGVTRAVRAANKLLPKFYVYVLLDPTRAGAYNYDKALGLKFKNEPFYVGKGCGGRVKDHNRVTASRSALYTKIRALKRQGLLPLYKKIVEGLTDTQALQIEECAVSLIGRAQLGKGPLLNLTSGGTGKGKVISIRGKRNMSMSKIRGYAALTDEEKRAGAVARTLGIQRHWDAQDPQDRKQRAALVSHGLHSMPARAKVLRRNNISIALRAAYEADPSIKIRSGIATSLTRGAYGEEQKAHMSSAVAAGHRARTPEAKRKSSAKMSAAGKARVLGESPEVQRSRADAISVAGLAYHASMSDAQRAARSASLSTGHANMPMEARLARDRKISCAIADIHSSRSAEDRAKIQMKIRITNWLKHPTLSGCPTAARKVWTLYDQHTCWTAPGEATLACTILTWIRDRTGRTPACAMPLLKEFMARPVSEEQAARRSVACSITKLVKNSGARAKVEKKLLGILGAADFNRVTATEVLHRVKDLIYRETGYIPYGYKVTP